MRPAVRIVVTLEWETFWRWLSEHADCIVRAGSGDIELYDAPDLHWHLEGAAQEPVVQLMRGKTLLAFIALDVSDIAFVRAAPPMDVEDRCTVFELVASGANGAFCPYHFAVAHPWGGEEGGAGPRVRH